MKTILSKIYISKIVYLLILFAFLAGYMKHVVLIMMIVLSHELGHVFFFCLFDIEVEKIIIYPFGGVTYVNKRLHERIYKDVLISLGGIFFQFILYLIFFICYRNNLVVESTYQIFKMYNISVVFFNLVPIVPLDGSKLFFAILSKFFSYKTSYFLMIVIGMASLIGFIIYNFVYRLNDIILYLFLGRELVEVLKNFKFVMNKFYLERILYNHYYNEIINDVSNIDKIRVDKFYYFKDGNRYVNERDYLKRWKF